MININVLGWVLDFSPFEHVHNKGTDGISAFLLLRGCARGKPSFRINMCEKREFYLRQPNHVLVIPIFGGVFCPRLFSGSDTSMSEGYLVGF